MSLLLSYQPPPLAPASGAWEGNHLKQPIWRRPTPFTAWGPDPWRDTAVRGERYLQHPFSRKSVEKS